MAAHFRMWGSTATCMVTSSDQLIEVQRFGQELEGSLPSTSMAMEEGRAQEGHDEVTNAEVAEEERILEEIVQVNQGIITREESNIKTRLRFRNPIEEEETKRKRTKEDDRNDLFLNLSKRTRRRSEVEQRMTGGISSKEGRSRRKSSGRRR